MPIDIRDPDLAQSFVQEGRLDATVEWATAALRRRFGDDVRLPRLATALARRSADRAAEMIDSAESAEALARTLDRE